MNIGQFYQSKTDKRDIIEIRGVIITNDLIGDYHIPIDPINGEWIGISVHRHSDLYFGKKAKLDVEELLKKYAFCAVAGRKVESIDGYEPTEWCVATFERGSRKVCGSSGFYTKRKALKIYAEHDKSEHSYFRVMHEKNYWKLCEKHGFLTHIKGE